MSKVLICYYSRTGNTKAMALKIADGVRNSGVEVTLKRVQDTLPSDFLKYEGIILGSPTYFGGMAGEVKILIDKSNKYYEKLKGKVGGAFTSSDDIGGGNETTIMQILQALLIHGMIITGDTDGEPYGPIAIKRPNKKVEKNCVEYGQKIGELVKKLHD